MGADAHGGAAAPTPRAAASLTVALLLLSSTALVPSSAFAPPPASAVGILAPAPGVATSAARRSTGAPRPKSSLILMSSSAEVGLGQPTELPDSLDDAAAIAAEACHALATQSGPLSRCRVDFDISVGDETYTQLKSSTEFMQKFVSALCYASIPGLMERRQDEMMRLAQARAELRALREEAGDDGAEAEEGEAASPAKGEEEELSPQKLRVQELTQIIASGGAHPEDSTWTGPKCRVYFPDEGSAALARRDWGATGPPDKALVPPCVEFASCGGVQLHDISDDRLVLFFCPRASEAESVEEILYKHETACPDALALTVFVNPLLVDMGVTGFGMAGRMLRERLIDGLVPAYYLRTLPWGALTRVWPRQFTVWQEDSDEPDGYRMIKSMSRLPSNPEVEDIYDIENGNMEDPEGRKGFGFLDGLGDFVNGMTRL